MADGLVYEGIAFAISSILVDMGGIGSLRSFCGSSYLSRGLACGYVCWAGRCVCRVQL